MASDDEVVDVIALANSVTSAPAFNLPPPGGGQGSSPPGGMGVTSQGFGQEGYVLDSSDEGPMARPRPEEFNFEVGVPYYLPFTTPYRDSWEIFRDDPISLKQLQSMRRQDGQARALYRLITMPILAALRNCVIRPPEPYKSPSGTPGQEEKQNGDGEAAEETEYVYNLFFAPASAGGMTHTFSHFIRRMLLATFDGYSGFEFVYWVPKIGPMKGKVCLRKIDWRPAETITFLLDGQGEFNGFRQRTFFQGRTIDVKIPKQRAFYFANSEEERPFYGISLFESAFYHYDKKTKLYYITHLAAQRAAVGTRVGTMPPNPAKQDKINFVNAMRDLGMTQYIVVPSEDWKVESLNESQGASFDFLGLINHHNNQMSKSVLASWFDDDTGKGKSESTLVDFGTKNDETFMMMETAIMDDIAARINRHIIPRFIDWNFGTGLYPEFHFGALTEDQQSAVQDIFEKLSTAPPGTISPEFMMGLEKRMAKICGLEIDYAPIEEKATEDNDLKRKANQATLKYQAAHPEGPPPAAAANKPAGSTAGKSGSTAGRSSSSSSSSSKPKSSKTKLTAVDTAMVQLVGDVLVDVMQERVGEELDE
jgi:Protein of unknown function (DUF935)